MILTATVDIHELYDFVSGERAAMYRELSNFLILYSC